MTEIAAGFINAASALGPVLNVFDGLAGRSLAGVWLRREDGILSEIVLDFGGTFLAATAEEEFDTLRVELRTEQVLAGFDAAGGASPWREHLGREFSWGWLTMNQQGYIDGVLIGFGDDIYPKLILNVMASEIKAGSIVFPDPSGR